METKYLKVKEKKIDSTLEFYSSFGWIETGERETLPHGKLGITIERDKERLDKSYSVVIKGERAYHRLARPYPLGAIIVFAIASASLVEYFVLKSTGFWLYILPLYASLALYGVTVYLLIIFFIIFAKRRSLLKKIVHNVAIDAGTVRELPLVNNIKEETDDTWLIANNL